jgi:hypothetical protein
MPKKIGGVSGNQIYVVGVGEKMSLKSLCGILRWYVAYLCVEYKT